MDITGEDNAAALTPWLSSLIIEVLYDLLRVVDGRVEKLARLLPSTIEVNTKETDSIVAVDDAIWVQHRNNLDDEFVSDFLSLWVVAKEPIYHTMDDVGCL